MSVVLRFEPRHYDRLLESIWHPTQFIHKDVDGYVVYSVKVSAPQEMAPWIRSWGSGVVVEEPPELRLRLMRSVMRQAQQYGLGLETGADNQSLVYRLWAKREPKRKPKAETTTYHLLIYHLLDVAAVACCMWEQVLGDGQKAWLAKTLGLEQEAARQQMALLAATHDIGKATPAFQKKALDLYDALCDMDVRLRERSKDTSHGILSAVILSRWLAEKDLNKMQASQLAAVIGGHHGDWITSTEMDQASAGKERWRELQDAILCELKGLLDVPEIALPSTANDFNVYAAFLSGFVSVCDWIGSDSTYFPFEERPIDLHEYLERVRKYALKALSGFGFLGWKPDSREAEFESVFPFAPNELQREGIEALSPLRQAPRLVLVEYPTGGGKTELALHIADMLINRFGLGGSYIAMPTQATSNQMFGRFVEYLEKRYPRENVNLHLVHGQADQQPLYQQIQERPQREGDESGVTAEDWFRNRKRALLAPHGVGSIDQAMLSVLQARHHFVRQFGLSHKVVIFDEIHSYDSYMNVIIERLLSWLHTLETPMILLSATLARQNRQALLEAVGATDSENALNTPYPRLTVVEQDGSVRTHRLPPPETRTVHIEAIPADLDSLLHEVKTRSAAGGCIAIVCNTVDESIEVARHLRGDEELADVIWLFHARYPPAWRGDIENEVLEAFGKDGDRPQRAILVATQIIEQSLDLDFDLMISRTAPIDLLIQRVGRLQRHQRGARPLHMTKPTLLWREPELNDDGLPCFGVDEVIYERFFLLKTWLKLRDMSALSTPDDIDAVMDFVYSEDCEHLEFAEELRAAYGKMELGSANSTFRGAQYVIGEPGDEEMIDSNSFRLKDNLENHVSTRDIKPGVDIICIVNREMESRLNRVPSKEDIDELLRYKVTVRRAEVKDGLERLREHEKWKSKAQLKFARVVTFDDGLFNVPESKYALRLTREYGLEIFLEEDA